MATTAVARVEGPAKSYALRSPVADILMGDEARAAIMPLLRPGDDYDRIIVEVYHAVSKTPELAKCDPKSIITATARAVSTGLVIGETVDLLPFGNRAEVCIRYTGAIELVQTSGAARYVDAQCVYANEVCEINQGTAASVRHIPLLNEKKRGDLIGAYAVAKVTRDDFRIVYMTVEDIDTIRLAKSKSWKTGPLSKIPWYAKKTVIKQLCKTLPKNRDLARVVALLDREDAEENELAGAERYELSDGSRTLAIAETSEAAGNSGGGDVAGESRRGKGASSSSESAPSSAADDALPWEAAPTPHACEAFKIPNGLGPRSAQEIGTLLTVDLEQLYSWSKRQPEGKYPGLADNCEELLELRRLGEAHEPKAEG